MTTAMVGVVVSVLAFITELDVAATILDHLGLSSPIPPIAPARAPPEDPRDLDLGL